jgi:hypothetical protein
VVATGEFSSVPHTDIRRATTLSSIHGDEFGDPSLLFALEREFEVRTDLGSAGATIDSIFSTLPAEEERPVFTGGGPELFV